jgi:hypothetical protein
VRDKSTVALVDDDSSGEELLIIVNDGHLKTTDGGWSQLVRQTIQIIYNSSLDHSINKINFQLKFDLFDLMN